MAFQLSSGSLGGGHIQQRMRKATSSCVECEYNSGSYISPTKRTYANTTLWTGRRRKTRCVIQPSSSKCGQCFERGVQCVDQSRVNLGSMIERKSNLRMRVARLESQMSLILGTNPNIEPFEPNGELALDHITSLAK